VRCFLLFSSSPLSPSLSHNIYIIRCRFTKYHVSRDLFAPDVVGTNTGQIIHNHLLLLFSRYCHMRRVWANSPDPVGVASSSGEVCHPPTPDPCNMKNTSATLPLCNVILITLNRFIAASPLTPPCCGSLQRRDCNVRLDNIVQSKPMILPGSLLLQQHQQDPRYYVTSVSECEPTLGLTMPSAVNACASFRYYNHQHEEAAGASHHITVRRMHGAFLSCNLQADTRWHQTTFYVASTASSFRRRRTN
jgi:hypothetical protein